MGKEYAMLREDCEYDQSDECDCMGEYCEYGKPIQVIDHGEGKEAETIILYGDVFRPQTNPTKDINQPKDIDLLEEAKGEGVLTINKKDLQALEWLLYKGMEITNSNKKFEIFERLYDELISKK